MFNSVYMAVTENFVLINIENGQEVPEMLKINSSLSIDETTGSLNNFRTYLRTVPFDDDNITEIENNTVILYGAPENLLEITSELGAGCFSNVPNINEPYLNKVSFYFPFKEGYAYNVSTGLMQDPSTNRFIDITINNTTLFGKLLDFKKVYIPADERNKVEDENKDNS